jgi:hypothetical protein
MHTAVRPFASVGVSLVGATAIAVTPVIAPTVSTQIHRMGAQIEQAAVHLTAAADPLAAYNQLVNDTVTNLQYIASTAQTNGPTPILTAAFNNQVAALQDIVELLSSPGSLSVSTSGHPAVPFTPSAPLGTALGSALGQIGTNLTTAVPPLLNSALSDLTSGDVEDATNQLLLVGLNALIPLTNLLTPGLNAIANPLQAFVTAADQLGPLAAVIANPLQNAVNVLNTLNQGYGGLQPSNALVIVGGLLGPLIEAPAALGAAVQNVINAAQTGDLSKVATAVLSIPATVVDGVLNGGFGPDLSTVIDTGLPGVPLYAGGLLTTFGINIGSGPLGFTVNLPGPIAALQILQKLVADALAPPAVTPTKTVATSTSAVAALPAANSVPAVAQKISLPAATAKASSATATATGTTAAGQTSTNSETAATPAKTAATESSSTTSKNTDTTSTGTAKPSAAGTSAGADTSATKPPGTGQNGSKDQGAGHSEGGKPHTNTKPATAHSDGTPSFHDAHGGNGGHGK